MFDAFLRRFEGSTSSGLTSATSQRSLAAVIELVFGLFLISGTGFLYLRRRVAGWGVLLLRLAVLMVVASAAVEVHPLFGLAGMVVAWAVPPVVLAYLVSCLNTPAVALETQEGASAELESLGWFGLGGIGWSSSGRTAVGVTVLLVRLLKLGAGVVFLLVLLLAAAAFLADAARVGSESVLTAISVGTDPLQMQLTPDGSKLLVSNAQSDTVSVISTATDTVVAAIPVGMGPGPIRITPNGQKAYVVNELSNNVSVINVTTNSFITNVAVGTNPVTLSRSDDGVKVYVANKGSNSVSVICTGLVPSVCSSTDAVIGSPIAVGTAPNVMAKTPDGSQLYVANQTSDDVSVISTASDSVVHTISLLPSEDPGSTHFLPNGTKAYIANRGCVAPASACPSTSIPPSVSVINVATNTVMTTITGPGFGVGDAPHAMRVTPDGSKLYVVNKHGDEVMVIDTATDTILRFLQLQQGSCTNMSLGVGSCPVRIELTPDGSKAYVLEERPLAANGALTAICTGIVPAVCASTDTILNTTLVGSSPTDLEIKGGIKAYVSNSLSNNVSVVALPITPTNTPTSTNTPGPTSTATNTRTPTNTPTQTNTPSAPTATFTVTFIQTASNTFTPTPANTAGPTSTPPDTPTPTPTITPGGPTLTPTNAATPSNAPTATRTPTPHRLIGDANKDGQVNAVDAALVLQHDAGLLPSINPNADTNRNGEINAIDAALILQYGAGLLSHLPP